MLKGGIFTQAFAVVQITGKDSFSFLQGQTTNDVSKLISINSVQLNSLLSPQGRIESVFSLIKIDEGFLVILETHYLERFQKRIDKFLISEDVEINLLFNKNFKIVIGFESILKIKKYKHHPIYYNGESALLLLDENSEVEDVSQVNEMDVNNLMYYHGLFPIDFDHPPLLTETFYSERALSQDKGCYPGQETVAKILSRKGAGLYPAFLESNSSELIVLEESFGKIIYTVKHNNFINYFVLLNRSYRIHNAEYNISGANEEKVILRCKLYPLVFFSENDRLQEFYYESLEYYNNNNDFKASERNLNLIIEHFPDFSEAYESLGVLLSKESRFLEAIELMKKLVLLKPNDVMPYTNLSLFYMKIGEIKTAEDYKAEATLRTFDQFGQISRDKKKLENKNQQQKIEKENSKRMFLEVLEIDPEDSIALYGLGEIHFFFKEYINSLNYIQSLLTFDPDHIKGNLLLAKILIEQNKIPEALFILNSKKIIAATKGETKMANVFQELIDQYKN